MLISKKGLARADTAVSARKPAAIGQTSRIPREAAKLIFGRHFAQQDPV